jgi:hypothetical protein
MTAKAKHPLQPLIKDENGCTRFKDLIKIKQVEAALDGKEIEVYVVVSEMFGDNPGTAIYDICLEKEEAVRKADKYNEEEEEKESTPHGYEEFNIEVHKLIVGVGKED